MRRRERHRRRLRAAMTPLPAFPPRGRTERNLPNPAPPRLPNLAVRCAHGVQGLLPDARRGQDRHAGRDQEELPQAGAQVPPRREQGVGRQAAHDRAQRGQRGAFRPRAPRRLRRARGAARLGPPCRARLRAAAGLGRRLRLRRRRRHGRAQRLLLAAVRPRRACLARAPRARRRRAAAARRGPPCRDRDRPARRLRRRDARPHPACRAARSGDGRGRRRRQDAAGADPEGRQGRAADPARRAGRRRLWRRAGGRPLPRDQLRARSALPRRRPRRDRDRAGHALGGGARRADRGADAVRARAGQRARRIRRPGAGCA